MKSSWLSIILCLLYLNAVDAHEVRPASLEITEQQSGNLTIEWRQPVMGEYTISIYPRLSSGWLDREPDQRFVTGNALVRTWQVQQPQQPLAGQSIWIQGLDRTITDTFVRIRFANGDELTHLIKAISPQMEIPTEHDQAGSLPGYLRFGISHIWSGPDHLVYILGLILLISSIRTLVITITAFTIAHSITLACAALNLVQLRSAPVEAVISLSIIYVAVELVRAREGRPGLTSTMPWLIAFVFGLLHGFGFASALLEAGLPQDGVLMALLLFNAGIEVGQLVFLLLVIGLLKLLKDYLPIFRDGLVRLAPYGIGSAAGYWLVQRLAVIF